MSEQFRTFVPVGATGLIAFELGGRHSIRGVHSFVSTAQAAIGHPLAPASAAGVARRTTRRGGVYDR